MWFTNLSCLWFSLSEDEPEPIVLEVGGPLSSRVGAEAGEREELPLLAGDPVTDTAIPSEKAVEGDSATHEEGKALLT